MSQSYIEDSEEIRGETKEPMDSDHKILTYMVGLPTLVGLILWVTVFVRKLILS